MPSLLDRILGTVTSPLGLGTGLTLASALGRDEPGYVTQSRQFLRNRFASPQAIPQEYTQGLSELVAPFSPLLDQQQQRVLDLGLNRTAQLFPSSTGPQPGYDRTNFLNLARDQFLPQRNALLGDLALKMLDTRGNAANEVLRSGRPDPLTEALGTLGGILLWSGLNKGGGFGGGGETGLEGLLGGVNGISDQIFGDNFFGKGGSNLPGSGPLGWIRNALGGGGTRTSGISSLFPSGFDTSSGMALLSDPSVGGKIIQSLIPSFGPSVGFGNPMGGGLVELVDTATGYPIGAYNTATGASIDNFGNAVSAAPNAGGGFLSSFATPLAAGLGGFFSGRAIGSQLPGTQLGATAAGAAGGAAAGAAAGAIMGSIFDGPGAAIGAIIGGLAGGGGGFLGSRGTALKEKATRLASDQKSQGDTWGNIASFWTGSLGEAGYQDMDGWNSFLNGSKSRLPGGSASFSYGGISGNEDQPDDVAYVGSRILLKQIQIQHPEIQSLDQVPKFRQTYIDYILNNTYIEQGGNVVKTQNIGQKGSLLTRAGLSY